jgi:hypothetical protein
MCIFIGSQYIPEEVAEMAEKLDKMLYLLLEFISSEILLGDELFFYMSSSHGMEYRSLKITRRIIIQ